MQCPVDQTVLQMTERQGVEIDYCPQCRGVWLDRGELDKIIDRTVDVAPSGSAAPATYERRQDDRDRGSYPDQRSYKKKRKESFLGELFDF